MSIVHGTFTECVLSTEDMWMGGRSQPANFEELPSYPDLPDKHTPASL